MNIIRIVCSFLISGICLSTVDCGFPNLRKNLNQNGGKFPQHQQRDCQKTFHECHTNEDCHKSLSCKLDGATCTFKCTSALHSVKKRSFDDGDSQSETTVRAKTIMEIAEEMREWDIYLTKWALGITVVVILYAVFSNFQWKF